MSIVSSDQSKGLHIWLDQENCYQIYLVWNSCSTFSFSRVDGNTPMKNLRQVNHCDSVDLPLLLLEQELMVPKQCPYSLRAVATQVKFEKLVCPDAFYQKTLKFPNLLVCIFLIHLIQLQIELNFCAFFQPLCLCASFLIGKNQNHYLLYLKFDSWFRYQWVGGVVMQITTTHKWKYWLVTIQEKSQICGLLKIIYRSIKVLLIFIQGGLLLSYIYELYLVLKR